MNNDRICALARAVAAKLDGFTFEPPPEPWPTVHIAHADGRELALYLHWSTKRLTITGVLPGDYDDSYGLSPGHITVAPERDPAVIAREITRRLLPTYEASLAITRARIATRHEQEAARERLAAELIAAGPLTQLRSSDSGIRLAFWPEHVSGSVWIPTSASNVVLELQVSPALALALLATINEHKE